MLHEPVQRRRAVFVRGAEAVHADSKVRIDCFLRFYDNLFITIICESIVKETIPRGRQEALNKAMWP